MNSTLKDPIKTGETDRNDQVLNSSFSPSENFFLSDRILRHFLAVKASEEGLDWMEPRLEQLGRELATNMDELSLEADRNGPQLITRDLYGQTTNKLQFNPAYSELKRIALDSGMFRVKWEPHLKEQFASERHLLGFTAGFLFAMGECGLYCPLCMTDGAARLLDRYANPEDKQRLLPKIWTENHEDLYTGAMFLTEKTGGSDVGANQVSATIIEDGPFYTLKGEKWFCSNAGAEIIFVLARIDEKIKGIKGLSIFLLEPENADGSPNPMNFVRLKEKLGVRSMASAEIKFENTRAKLIGEPGQGFGIMTDMINLSRLYNAVAAISASRRALVESYQFLSARSSFGKNALQHALIRDKIWELASIQMADFYLCWMAIELLDKADCGNKDAAQTVRMLTPMIKKCSAESAVYIVRESMELMGGLGYIEQGIMPKLLRDTLVLPIWEGAGNIMILDMLRAAIKSEGLFNMVDFVREAIDKSPSYGDLLDKKIESVLNDVDSLADLSQQELELKAKDLFAELTDCCRIAALILNRDDQSAEWIDPALSWWWSQIKDGGINRQLPSVDGIRNLLAWELTTDADL